MYKLDIQAHTCIMETTMQRESDTGYQDDPCCCVHSQGQRIDGDDCPVHGENSNESEARSNMLVFVRTLPLIEDCNFGCSYDEHDGMQLMSACATNYNGVPFEGWGSSEAAAYGDLVKQIVERYA